MQADWTNELTIKFLELYEGERVLWDSKHKNHKLKHKVHDAWKNISLKLNNIHIDELKSKKKSLMATFRPLLKKKKSSIKSGAGVDEVFQPIWFAYDVMENFLGTIYDVEETINTEDNDKFQQNETMLPPPSPLSFHHDVEIPAPSPPLEHTKKSVPNVTKSRKRSSNSDLYILDEAKKKKNDSFDTLNNVLKSKKEEEDECDVYAKLLAKRLRKYPARMRDGLMYKIDGFLLDNPYPDDRPPSANSYYSSQTPSPYYQNSTPSPANNIININMIEGNDMQQNQELILQNYEIQSHSSQSLPIPEKTLSQSVIAPTNLANIFDSGYLSAYPKYP